MSKIKYLAWVACILTLLNSGCNTTRYLKEGELLLTKNEIVLARTKNAKKLKNLEYELSTLYKQQPNKKFLFVIPRQWFFYRSNRPGNTSKWQRWQARRAEPPAIFKDTLAITTRDQMQYYLNYLGYFQANVGYELIPRDKRVRVRYYVNPNDPVRIDTVHFASSDTAIHRILQEISAETVLKRGAPLEGRLYDAERERITRYLRNHGYAYFFSNQIAPLEVDTSHSQQKAEVFVEVNPPYDASRHQTYRVGRITVFSQFDPTLPDSLYLDTLVGNYLFKLRRPMFLVKPHTIIDGIYLYQGELYSQDDYDRTIQHLSALGVFRFVRIRLDASPSDPNVLDLRIELTPNVKYELGFDLEANYIDGTTLTGRGNLIGFSFLPTARNRNVFKGAELMVTNLNAGIEVNLSQIRNNAFWNSVELGLQNDLFFPKFVDYIGIWRGMNRLPIGKHRLLSNDFYQLLQSKATTRLSTRFSYIFNLGFYETSLFNASFGYDVPRNSNTRYVMDHIGIDYLRPATQPRFDSIIAANPFLARSFGKQLFVSFLFKEFNFVRHFRPNRYGQSGYLGLNLELAGAEVWLANAVYNAFALRQDTLRISGIDFSQYLRAEWDMRYYKEYSPKSSFASRLSIGIARPFGYTTDVPFVKQFFVGGPNSIRAWAARGLGPGGYLDTLSNNLTNRLLFYQTGDLKLELSAEMRFHLFSRLKGALFLDAGNVWTLRNDPARCGSQLLLRPHSSVNCPEHTPRNEAFYRQIAIGSGFGFRLDFTYFIFRLDLGVRLRNPRPVRNMMSLNPREADYWEDFKGFGMRDINFNFGLGYPF